MKKILTLCAFTMVLSACNKKDDIQPQQVVNNVFNTPCNQYGACSDGLYQVLNVNDSNCVGSQIYLKYIGNSTLDSTGTIHADSLVYVKQHINFDLKVLDFYSRQNIDLLYNERIDSLVFRTKTNKKIIFYRL